MVYVCALVSLCYTQSLGGVNSATLGEKLHNCYIKEYEDIE